MGIRSFVHVNGTSRRMEGIIGTALEWNGNKWREIIIIIIIIIIIRGAFKF